MSEATQRALEEIASQKAKTYSARAWAAGSAASGLAPVSIRRREPGAQDVQIAILYCGVCHSDLHQVRVHAKRQAWVGVSPSCACAIIGERRRGPLCTYNRLC